MAEEEEEEDENAGLEEEHVCPENAPEWVVTFGDMMSLLLTFFILLLSFSTMDVLRFKDLAGSIKQAFGVKAVERIDPIPMAEDHVEVQPKVDFNSKKMMEQLKRRLDPDARKKREAKVDIEIFETYRGVVVLLSGEDLYEEGTDRLKPTALTLLGFVAEQAHDEAGPLTKFEFASWGLGLSALCVWGAGRREARP